MKFKFSKPPRPVVGQRKTKKCFAWLPVLLVCKTWIWLESYYSEYEWSHYIDLDDSWGTGWYFRGRHQGNTLKLKTPHASPHSHPNYTAEAYNIPELGKIK